MFEKYCPTTQRACKDGVPDGQTAGEQLVCIFWDSIDAKCNFATGAAAARSFEESLIESMGGYIAQQERTLKARQMLDEAVAESVAKGIGTARAEDIANHV